MLSGTLREFWTRHLPQVCPPVPALPLGPEVTESELPTEHLLALVIDARTEHELAVQDARLATRAAIYAEEKELRLLREYSLLKARLDRQISVEAAQSADDRGWEDPTDVEKVD